MIQINISQARQVLPQLITRVYQGEEFIIVKNKIPIAQLIPFKKRRIKKVQKAIIPQATRLFKHLQGTSLEIADKLRQKAWQGSYGN